MIRSKAGQRAVELGDAFPTFDVLVVEHERDSKHVPTIVRSGGFEIRILTFDHPPAHVHGFKAGKKAKVELADDVLLVKTTMSAQTPRRSSR